MNILISFIGKYRITLYSKIYFDANNLINVFKVNGRDVNFFAESNLSIYKHN